VKADVVYCPVEDISAKRGFSEIAAFRNKWKTGQDDLVFLHVARWERHKGHEFLVQAAKLLELNISWKVWFVGKPQRDSEERYRREILNSVERQGLAENVLFLGWQDDLSLVLAASDVYCQPNINPEPFGISIIEAMYAKLPVIVTPLGGPKETVTNSCGIHVEPNNVDDLASLMNRLFDKNHRSYLGENGRKRAIELSLPSAQLNKFCSLIS
jgi:glycosyltransferase involved in cell wall biosynthesis